MSNGEFANLNEKDRIVQRLEDSEISTNNLFVDVADGEKVCYDQHQKAENRHSKPPEGNWGIYPTATDTLVILDVDDYRELDDDHEGLQALEELPETLTEQSPHGGTHHIYHVPVTDGGQFPAAYFEGEIGAKNPVPSWGEVQVHNAYAVAAGSYLNSCGKDWHDCTDDGEGDYELVEDREIATVSPDKMLAVLLADPDIERPMANSGYDDSGSDDFDDDDVDISVYDVISRGKYPPEEKLPHPVHGSDTGKNFQVDKGGETWKCWSGGAYEKENSAHGTGNALHLIGVQEGIVSCGEWKPGGLSSETWADIFEAARDRGFDVGEPPESYSGPSLDATESVDDGGVVEDSEDSSRGVEDRIRHEVLIPYDPPADMDDVEEITKQTAIDRIARIFDTEWSFMWPRNDVQGWVNTLYYYDDEMGIYLPYGKDEIETRAERLLGDFSDDKVVRELVNKIKRRNTVRPREISEPHPARLVVGNGILDLRTGELEDFTPDEYHRTRLSIDYNPNAECDEIDAFMNDIVEPDNVGTLYRLIAHTIYKDYPTGKAAMLVGDGQNGKSVFLSLIEEFLGESNVTGRSLHDIENSRFAKNNLHNKMANIHPDMSGEKLTSSSDFKKLTGDDKITADVKYEKPVNFKNYATLIFAANSVPPFPEDNRAIWRRWIYINFPNTFKGDNQTPKRVLMRKLTQESELEGLLSRCVQEIQEWWDGRDWYPEIPTPEETRKELKRASEPIFEFATSCIHRGEGDDYVEKSKVFEAYRKYARAEGLPAKDDSVISKKLLHLDDYEIDDGRSRKPSDDGSLTPVFWGMKLSPRGRQLLGLDDDTDDEQDGLDSDYDDEDDADGSEGGDSSDSTESDSNAVKSDSDNAEDDDTGNKTESKHDQKSGDKSESGNSVGLKIESERLHQYGDDEAEAEDEQEEEPAEGDDSEDGVDPVNELGEQVAAKVAMTGEKTDASVDDVIEAYDGLDGSDRDVVEVLFENPDLATDEYGMY